MKDFVLQARKPVWQKQKKGKKGGKKSAKNQKSVGKTIASKKNDDKKVDDKKIDDKKSEDKMANAAEVSKGVFFVILVHKRHIFLLSLMNNQMVMEVELINFRVDQHYPVQRNISFKLHCCHKHGSCMIG
jgi:hypothetical protein